MDLHSPNPHIHWNFTLSLTAKAYIKLLSEYRLTLEYIKHFCSKKTCLSFYVYKYPLTFHAFQCYPPTKMAAVKAQIQVLDGSKVRKKVKELLN